MIGTLALAGNCSSAVDQSVICACGAADSTEEKFASVGIASITYQKDKQVCLLLQSAFRFRSAWIEWSSHAAIFKLSRIRHCLFAILANLLDDRQDLCIYTYFLWFKWVPTAKPAFSCHTWLLILGMWLTLQPTEGLLVCRFFAA